MKCPDCGQSNIAGADDCGACGAPLVNVAAKSAPKGLERKILEGFVSDLSPRKAVTVAAGDSLSDAVLAMRKAKVGCVLVFEGASLAGVLSEWELLQHPAAGPELVDLPVGRILRANPTVLRETDQVAEMVHQMAISGHRHVPVALKGGGYGVVSARDLLHYLSK